MKPIGVIIFQYEFKILDVNTNSRFSINIEWHAYPCIVCQAFLNERQELPPTNGEKIEQIRAKQYKGGVEQRVEHE